MKNTQILHNFFIEKGATEDLGTLIDKAFETLEKGSISFDLSKSEQKIVEANKQFISNDTSKPFVVDGNKFYLQRYYLYQEKIVESIKRLSVDVANLPERTALINENSQLLDELFSYNGQGVNWQREAGLNSFSSNFSIITGGPGTGKTFTVSNIIALLFKLNPALRIALVAQTGKAAQRLQESLEKEINRLCKILGNEIKPFLDNINSSTIHRLLGANFEAFGVDFKHNSENTVPYDVVVIDEASMIDIPLMAKLLDAIKIGTQVIILGDKNQLVSVEAGSVFSDMCASGKFLNDKKEGEQTQNILDFKICELIESRRFKDGGKIAAIASYLLDKKDVTLENACDVVGNDEDNFIIDEEYNLNSETYKTFVNNYINFIEETDIKVALEKLNDVRILCAVREGDWGVKKFNERIEQILREKEKLDTTQTFYNNRPIIVTQNDYEVGVFNGDVGIVRFEGNVPFVYFEDKKITDGYKKVQASLIKHCETVFAMTVHKSQGSEFKNVVVVIPQDSDSNEDVRSEIITSELLFTGITRAKNQALIMCTKPHIQKIKERKAERASGIVEKLKNQ